MLQSRLRRDVLVALQQAKDDALSLDVSCQFWQDADSASIHKRPVDIAQSICELLLATIEPKIHRNTRALDDSIASKCSVLSRLALVVKDESVTSLPERAKEVHSLRITDSHAAFRDWGDIGLLL